MSPTPLYPRGNPLTESMPFTARDGAQWLVYMEGGSAPRLRRLYQATLPGRRLRFDSAAESRVTSEFPAGSPFLSDARLQDLLDRAHPVPASAGYDWEPDGFPVHAPRVSGWTARAGKLGRVGLAAALAAVRDMAGALVGLVRRIASGGRRARPEARPADHLLGGPSSPARPWRGARLPHRLRPR